MSKYFIRDATDKKLKLREQWLAQENEYNIIDVSLCAGQTIVPGKDNEQFSEFVEVLYIFIQQLFSLFPFITFTEKGFLHSTLLTIFNDNEILFDDYKSNLINLCKEITREFDRYSPLTINFEDIVLTSNGSIILLGESTGVFEFRNYVYNQYNMHDSLRKNIIHITLGRLFKNESVENMGDVDTFLRMKGRLSLPPVTINYPKIILSRDMLCMNVDTNLTCEFNTSI
ncbi:hypothetical protein ABW286_09620 [Erwinia papayae]|uniref:Uncharacterized protein n=1 Tax=Erwinia papayae TaxID=206499 RepID=A0ABV3N0U7_9GAMM